MNSLESSPPSNDYLYNINIFQNFNLLNKPIKNKFFFNSNNSDYFIHHFSKNNNIKT